MGSAMKHEVGGFVNKMLSSFLRLNTTVIVTATLNLNYRNTFMAL